MNRFLKEHRFEAGIVAVALVLFVFRLPETINGFQIRHLQRETYKAEQEANALIHARDIARREAEPIANDRYANGCEAVFQLDNTGTYIALAANRPVIKGNFADYYAANPLRDSEIPHSHVLPVGMTVCDAYGNTGVIAASEDPRLNGLPVVTDMVTTTNREVIDQSLSRRYRGKYRPDAVR